MEILNAKNVIMQNINDIFQNYESHKINAALELKEYGSKLNDAHLLNKKLLEENNEKDKLLTLSEQKMVDYEDMINKIQDEANKELSEKERFNMLRAQDKEIHIRDIEIKKLQSEINKLQEKNKNKCSLELIEKKQNEDHEKIYKDYWKNRKCNSFYKDKEKLKIAIKAYSKHLNTHSITDECVGRTSIGINGWYEDYISNKGKLVDKMKNIILEQDENIEESIEETKPEGWSPTSSNYPLDKDTPVIETDVTVTEELTSDEEGPQAEPSPDGSIASDEEDNKEDDEEDNKEEEEEGEAISVTMIKHYRKEYYTIDGEEPQYIYSIDDGDLGDKVGEIKGKKKIFYDKQ